MCFVWYGYTIPRILFGVNGTLRVLCGFVFYAQNQKLKLWYDEVEYLTGEQLYEKILVDLQEFAERIIECIGPRHGAKKELAEHLGIHPNVITNWLNGRNKSYRRYVNEIAAFYGVSVDYLLGNADSKEKQPDSQNENQAVKDELIAFYGDVKDDLTPDDIDDLMVAMRAKAERNKKKKSGV